MLYFFAKFIHLPRGVMDKAVECGTEGPWFDSCHRQLFLFIDILTKKKKKKKNLKKFFKKFFLNFFFVYLFGLGAFDTKFLFRDLILWEVITCNWQVKCLEI